MTQTIEKTLFRISKMDCPSEEELVRMALKNSTSLHRLEFNLKKRTLLVFHTGTKEAYLDALATLKMNAQLVKSSLVNVDDDFWTNSPKNEAKVLKTLLLINGAMFVAEIIFGLIAESTGLIADSVDMFADAAVYSLSLYAVGHSVTKQKDAARLSGYMQLALALGAAFEVVRRYIFGSQPEPTFMIGVAVIALIANVSCLVLLSKHRDAGIHMKASWIFSTNDVIANLGVIIAGILVATTGSRAPDLIIGGVIALVVLRGALQILRLSRLDVKSFSNNSKERA